MVYHMVDRATPPLDAELGMLRANNVTSIAGYVGGVNNGGRAWKPADVDRVKKAGFTFLPIYVGENVCPGCKSPVSLTASQGSSDGHDAVSCATAFGCPSGPLCLDVEYSTYVSNIAGALAYMAAWAHAVHDAGYLPVQYAITRTPNDYQPDIPTGMWIANWDGAGDLSKFPNAARFTGIGWQFTDNWHGFDVSHVDGAWWRTSSPPENNPCRFFPETQHSVCFGFRAFWESYGDKAVPTFGYPISQEFSENGHTVQYFERARFEWHPGSGQNPWDVLLGRLGDEDADNARAANPQAFAPVPAP